MPTSRTRAVGLPSWARTKPVDGVLAVPSSLGASLKKALGALARPIVPSTRFVAVEANGGWGLGRQLQLAPGKGADVAKTLAVLAKHELPMVHLDLQVAPGAAAELKAALAGAEVGQLASLTVGLKEALACGPELAAAVARMQRLRALHLVAKGGAGAAAVVEAAAALRVLSLVSVGLGGADLKRLARAAALQRLEVLRLLHVQATDAEVGALLAAPWAKSSLTSLALSRAEKLPADYPGLGALEALREVDLGFVSADGLAAMARAPFLPMLVRLQLHGTKVGAPVATRLAARGLPALEVLHLKWAEVDAKAIDALVKAAPRLTLLELPAGVKAQRSWVKKGRQIL